MLTPTQIQKLISQYYTADFEVSMDRFHLLMSTRSDAMPIPLLQTPISSEILRAVAARVVPGERTDHLLLPPETDEAGPYELPHPREISSLETFVPGSSSLILFDACSPNVRLRLTSLLSRSSSEYVNVPFVRRFVTLLVTA